MNDQDINQAVAAGIVSAEQAEQLRAMRAQSQTTSAPTTNSADVADPFTPNPDVEALRLVSGFQDVFVVIAGLLVIVSVAFSLTGLSGHLVSAATAWALSEFFVRKRRMALPAIVFLVAFLWHVFLASASISSFHHTFQPSHWGSAMVPAATITLLAAILHWWRFKVPISVAAGMAALCAVIMAMMPFKWYGIISFGLGIITFVVAMCWDMQDTQRQTRKTDVAFWLHLLAAPMIVHPLFSGQTAMGMSMTQVVIVLLAYLLIASISLLIDRRALMVSALGYVLFAISSALQHAAWVETSFAVTGILIGSLLLMLSAFWQRCRRWVMHAIPGTYRCYFPALSTEKDKINL